MTARPFRLTRAPDPYEADTQGAFFQWVRNWGVREFPELEWMFAVPNGGKRSLITAANLKKQGVKAGVWDTNLPVARKGYLGLWIEWKRWGEGLTPAQEKFGEFIVAEGHAAHICSDVLVGINIVREYLSA